ncbi:MAG: hypothetical protein K5656_06830 [Lachnospiraceae bacterium]|nr:hypothetical protein [Lachnospiraceae bacterium]
MPKINYIDHFTRQDLEIIASLGSTVLNNFLMDGLETKQAMAKRHKLMKGLSTMRNLDVNAERAEEMYGEDMPEVVEFLSENGNDAITLQDSYDAKVGFEPFDNALAGADFKRFKNPLMNQVIGNMLNSLKEVSSMLGDYLKNNKFLFDYDRKLLESYKKLMDDYISGKGLTERYKENPHLVKSGQIVTMVLGFNTPSMLYLADDKTGKYKFTVSGYKPVDWKDVSINAERTGILGCLNKSLDLEKAKSDYATTGDATRHSIRKAYVEYLAEAEKVFGMTEKSYNQMKPYLGTGYIDIAGERAAKFALYDAEAHIKLIDAGYPMSDMSSISQFYCLMKDFETSYKEKNDTAFQDAYDKMNAVWQFVVDKQYIDKNIRKTAIETMAKTLEDVADSLGDKTTFDLKGVSRTLTNRITNDKALSKREKAEIGAGSTMLSVMIDYVDPALVSSSSQFKNMKECINKFSSIDRKKDPAGYLYWRDKSTAATKEYILFKHKQLNNPKAGHKRSALEANRVKTANNILQRLESMERKDTMVSLAHDTRVQVGTDVEYNEIRNLLVGEVLLEKAREDISRYLNAMKAVLVNSQKNYDANFENDATEGSKEYRAYTQALEHCLKVLEDKNCSPEEITNSLKTLHKNAKHYKNEKDGIFFNPLTTSGKNRFDQAVDAMKEIPGLVYTYEAARRKLMNYRDEHGYSYANKPLSKIKEMAEPYKEYFPDMMKYDVNFKDINATYSDHKELSKLQVKVSNRLVKDNQLLKDEYNYGKSLDYFTAAGPKMNSYEMARNYVTLKYLNELYNPDATMVTTNKIIRDINEHVIEKDIMSLSESNVFKAMIKKNRHTALSEWEKVDKRIKDIEKIVKDKYEGLYTGNNAGYETLGNYINKREGFDDFYTAAATANVCEMLLDPKNKQARRILEAMAADKTVNPEEELDILIEVGAKTMERKLNGVKNKYKSNKDPIASDGIDYNKARKDPSIISKVNSDIINKFKANTKVREANAEAIAKNAKKVNENKGPGIGF